MKNLYNILVLITILFSSNFVKSQDDILSKINKIGTLEQKVMMPMRDGVRLATDIYIPNSDKKVPIIFSRTPYNFNSWGDGEEKNRTHQRAYEALKRGYAYVVQNERGRYFSVADSRSGKNYVLLGFEVAKGLFENADPVGQTVKISGRNLKVLGVFKKEGEDILNSSIDNAVLIPINYARNIVDTKSDNFDPKIIIKAASNITLNELANEMKGQIRAIRRLSPREDDDFSLNQSSMLSLQLDSLFGVVNIAGWIIGGFSILVGGFGIANIMFVSVKERTNIIGIQKSLGAKNYFILLQFLVEAVVLSIIGGIIGLIIVYIITLVAAAFDFELVLSLANCVLGLGVSAVIGVISGFLPAWNASQLNPVDAIRAK